MSGQRGTMESVLGEPQDTWESLERSIVRIGLETYRSYERRERNANRYCGWGQVVTTRPWASTEAVSTIATPLRPFFSSEFLQFFYRLLLEPEEQASLFFFVANQLFSLQHADDPPIYSVERERERDTPKSSRRVYPKRARERSESDAFLCDDACARRTSTNRRSARATPSWCSVVVVRGRPTARSVAHARRVLLTFAALRSIAWTSSKTL